MHEYIGSCITLVYLEPILDKTCGSLCSDMECCMCILVLLTIIFYLKQVFLHVHVEFFFMAGAIQLLEHEEAVTFHY